MPEEKKPITDTEGRTFGGRKAGADPFAPQPEEHEPEPPPVPLKSEPLVTPGPQIVQRPGEPAPPEHDAFALRGESFLPPPAPLPGDHPAKPKSAEPEKAKGAHPKAAERAEPEKPEKTAVKIVGVSMEAQNVVMVHARVHDHDYAVKFQKSDLDTYADKKAKQKYVAGHIKSVADRGIPKSVPNDELDLLGTVEI